MQIFSEGDKKFTKHSAYESLQHYMASPLFNEWWQFCCDLDK